MGKRQNLKPIPYQPVAGLSSTGASRAGEVLKVEETTQILGKPLGHTSVGYSVEEGPLPITAEHLHGACPGNLRSTVRVKRDPRWEPGEMLPISWGNDLESTYDSHS